MRAALLRYRILANIVGVLLIPLVLFAWPRHLLYDESSDIYQAGEWVNTYLGPLHGLFYILFFFATVLLSRRVRWSLPFTAVTVVAGTVPFVSFWAEHRATRGYAASRPSRRAPGRAFQDLPGDDATAGVNR